MKIDFLIWNLCSDYSYIHSITYRTNALCIKLQVVETCFLLYETTGKKRWPRVEYFRSKWMQHMSQLLLVVRIFSGSFQTVVILYAQIQGWFLYRHIMCSTVIRSFDEWYLWEPFHLFGWPFRFFNGSNSVIST